MAYVVLYRKYRSQTFADLVGQEHVVRTLQNGIRSGRIAHAFLFTGPRGTGKTSTARLMAKALNCEKGPAPEPCNVCDNCVAITNGTCIDVEEMDAASESSVEKVRDAIVQIAEYKPAYCRYKVFIIDEVHDLSAKAFDALLKTIEEPPEHVVFILATTEFNKVPPTIRARCQKFEFHRGSVGDLVQRLQFVADQEGIQVEPAALSAIARMADGGYRDALNLFEQANLTSEGVLTPAHVYAQLGLISDDVIDRILIAIREQRPADLVSILDEVYRSGRDARAVLESMLYRLSDLTRAQLGVESSAVGDSALEAARHELASRLSESVLLRLRAAVADAHRAIRDISLPRLWLEAELLRWLQPEAAPVRTEEATAPTRSAPTAPPAVKPAADSLKKVAPVQTENGEMEEAHEVWSQTVASLAQYGAFAQRLPHSRVVRQDAKGIRVDFSRQVDYDWVHAHPGRLKTIRDALHLLRPDWKVEFGQSPATSAKAAVSQSAPDTTVELMLEGESLADAGKDILGSL